MAEYAHYSTIDPEFEKVLATFPVPPPVDPASATPERYAAETEKVFTEVITPANRARYEPLADASTYEVENHTVPVDAGEIPVRVVRPVSTGKDETFPLVVYIHGGGFWAGGIDLRDYWLRYLSSKLKIVTVNVGYRTDPYPRPQDDSYAALKWAAANAARLAADPAKGFIVMGQSAGGQISAVLAQRAVADAAFAAHPLTGQILQIPVLCFPVAGPSGYYPEQYKDRLLSLEQNKDAPGLTKDYVLKVVDWYGGDPASPDLSPLFTPSLKGLPRALVQVSGLDPLRDDALLYADRLKEAGVETKLEVYPGVSHGFEDIAPDISLATKLQKGVEEAIGWMVSQSS